MMNENKVYQAYYTKSEPIVQYMVKLLQLKGNETIFEPCAGDGVFIDSILQEFSEVKIDAFELNQFSFQQLSKKYDSNNNITLKQTDTLTDSDLEMICADGGKYDAVIANPPYGAWRDVTERKKLKQKYHGFYAKESYSLFLYRSIEALKNTGKLVFIIPDTYLNLHRHKDIRKYILTNTKITEIALFPSSYFPGVNFGYANLSIIALEKCTSKTVCLANDFKVISRYQSVEDLNKENLKHTSTLTLSQKEIFETHNFTFITNTNKKITACLQKAKLTIGDICNCATGFYSGNDKAFLKVRNRTIRNAKRYELVDLEKVLFDCDTSLVNGITDTKETFVPIVKGGNTRYYKPDNWFMEWSSDMVDFYKKNKKARYQNSTFYFKKGIAVPMISSTSITGALLENRLFDQSIVGVFPKKIDYLYFLLSFFNSPTCNQLIRTINPSTNNSSNYIKRIPVLLPNKAAIKIINTNCKKILTQVKTHNKYDINLEKENNELIKKRYGF